MAAGQVFVMINGEIDLSIGAVYLFTPFWFHKVHHFGLPIYPALIVALLTAMVIGSINGFFVAVVGISSFVATLGMLFVLDGITLVMSHCDASWQCRHRLWRRILRPGFRRRDVLGADLGAGDRRGPAARADVVAMGGVHGGGGRQPARIGRGRRSAFAWC